MAFFVKNRKFNDKIIMENIEKKNDLLKILWIKNPGKNTQKNYCNLLF